MKKINEKQSRSQNPTRTTTHNMRYTTKCMTQSAFQKKIVNMIQQACDKVVEAMDIIDEVGAIAGFDVHFERCVERDEQGDHRGEHSRHSNGNLNVNLGNRYDQSNHDEADDIDDINYSDEIKEVTLPELADMVAERTCFKPECTLCVLNTAFDVMDEQNLMLDLGTISADTSEEGTEEDAEDLEDVEDMKDAEDADTDEDVEAGEYDDDGSYDYDDDELASQPTRNATRRDRQW